MNDDFLQKVCDATGAVSVSKLEDIQSLWSGYGAISRYALTHTESTNTVVVKHVKLPDNHQHPRGWNTNFSHQRKIKSYQVESAWYRDYSALCKDTCRVATCYGLEAADDEFLMILEDLDASGYAIRKEDASLDDMKLCLRWLANFYAVFLGKLPQSLWQQGTYWHLDTRPDELAALDDVSLKHAASKIDQILRECPYQTLVHGDAKLANFCFSNDSKDVAAVDFQYVGGGCGMKDVAYFIGSCLHEDDCEYYEQELLDSYFTYLKEAISTYQLNMDASAVEASWRPLFPIAWTDFHRFLKGWSPGHWKLHGYSERLARTVLAQLTEESG